MSLWKRDEKSSLLNDYKKKIKDLEINASKELEYVTNIQNELDDVNNSFNKIFEDPYYKSSLQKKIDKFAEEKFSYVIGRKKLNKKIKLIKAILKNSVSTSDKFLKLYKQMRDGLALLIKLERSIYPEYHQGGKNFGKEIEELRNNISNNLLEKEINNWLKNLPEIVKFLDDEGELDDYDLINSKKSHQDLGKIERTRPNASAAFYSPGTSDLEMAKQIIEHLKETQIQETILKAGQQIETILRIVSTLQQELKRIYEEAKKIEKFSNQ